MPRPRHPGPPAPLAAPARALARWRHYLAQDGSHLGLSRFHTRHRLVLLVHDPDAYQALTALVQDAPAAGLGATHVGYGQHLEAALSHRPSRARHLNVLEHVARGVLELASEEERRSWSAALRAYRRDTVGLSVPQGLLRGMLRRVAQRYCVAQQTYLDPAPGLRQAP